MVTLYERMQFWFKYDAVNPRAIGNNVCEATDDLKAALRSVMTTQNVMVVCARSVGCG